MLKQEAVQTERHMLRAFGFVVHVEHPHRFILNYCQMVLFDTVKHPERCAPPPLGCGCGPGLWASVKGVWERAGVRFGLLCAGFPPASALRCSGPVTSLAPLLPATLTRAATAPTLPPTRPQQGAAARAAAGGVEHGQRQPAHAAVRDVPRRGGRLRHHLHRRAQAQGATSRRLAVFTVAPAACLAVALCRAEAVCAAAGSVRCVGSMLAPPSPR